VVCCIQHCASHERTGLVDETEVAVLPIASATFGRLIGPLEPMEADQARQRGQLGGVVLVALRAQGLGGHEKASTLGVGQSRVL